MLYFLFYKDKMLITFFNWANFRLHIFICILFNQQLYRKKLDFSEIRIRIVIV